MSTIDLILEEAAAYGLRNEVKDMAESIMKTLTEIGMDDAFTREQVYQEAFETCVNAPDYLDYYKSKFNP